MIAEKNSVTVTIPQRISGFFEIVDNPKINMKGIQREEKIGSRGAGFNLTAFGKTTIKYEKLNDSMVSECSIFINGDQLDQSAETTYYIFDNIKSFFNYPFKITIHHKFDLPVGCGYGASGAGALGTIFGFNKLLNLGLSKKECSRTAHIAEVVNKTGLGTVCGQLQGGLCVLEEPGFPCMSHRIKIPKDLKVICGTFGPIKTKSILSDPDLNLRIKKAGQNAMKILNQTPNISTFMKVSKEFVYKTEIMDILKLYETKELITQLDGLNTYGASMNQLGRSVYCVCNHEEKREVLEIFESYKPKIKTFIFEINENEPIKFL
ncbi:MAG: hypothetical protein P8Y70_17040 [Candidatus Lokiarchaeota archaeon]